VAEKYNYSITKLRTIAIYGFKDIRMNKKATEEGNTRTERGVPSGIPI